MITTGNEKVVMKKWLKVKSNEKTCQMKWTDQKVDGTKNGLMKIMDSTREKEKQRERERERKIERKKVIERFHHIMHCHYFISVPSLNHFVPQVVKS